MKKIIVNILKFIISLSFGMILVYWSIGKLNVSQKQQIVHVFNIASYKWLILLILAGFLSNFSRTRRWILLLRSTNHNPRFSNTFFAVTLMFFANLFFPRLGEIARCGVLAKYEGVPMEKSVGTMVLERLIDFISILFLGLVLIITQYDILYIYFYEVYSYLFSKFSASVNSFIFFIVFFIFLFFIYFLFPKKAFSWVYFDKIKYRVYSLWTGVVAIKYLEKKWEFLFHTIFIWICYILMPYFGFKSLVETSNLSLLAAVACVFFGGFAMVLTQGGIGAFPIVIQKVLLLYGINGIIGLSYGWISWSAQTISVIIGGILSLLLLPMFNGNNR
ncbi:MAG TPA: lysylphosphatidylglycerol synthase transmembrane domain-containing protein [Chitinophagales bacterium]|nr:lysylphosphatidylglycerol synthase transmembrane domain-containing protein [Chitinophagales bacterium]